MMSSFGSAVVSQTLRHSREMTLLCSPKVTQHNLGLVRSCARKEPFFAGGNNQRELRPAFCRFYHSVLLAANQCAIQAAGVTSLPTDHKREPHAFGVDDIACLQTSVQVVFPVWVTLSEQKWVTLA